MWAFDCQPARSPDGVGLLEWLPGCSPVPGLPEYASLQLIRQEFPFGLQPVTNFVARDGSTFEIEFISPESDCLFERGRLLRLRLLLRGRNRLCILSLSCSCVAMFSRGRLRRLDVLRGRKRSSFLSCRSASHRIHPPFVTLTISAT